MATKNNIPAGYKNSAVGIIPQEWKVKRLGACFSIGHGRDYKHLSNGDIPVYGSGGIICYVGSFLHDGETVCIGRKGTINKPFYYNGPIWTVDTLFYTHSFQSVLPRYVGYLFDSIDWMRYNEATGVPSLTAKTISNIKKAMPPMEEQRKIAEILGVWDEAIEKQGRLIEKLELRKRALMQHLLTGRTRLPGFTTPWQKVKLGEIGKTYNGLTGKSKEDFEDGNAKFIPYINVFSNEKVNIDKLGVVSVDESEKQNKVQYGDIFFTVSSETPDEVGMASVLLDEIENTYLNSFCFGYRLNDFEILNPIFASYILRGDRFRNYMMVLSQGSTRFNISKNEVMKLKIELPSLHEQKAIAEVLTTADDEIATNRKKLDALRLQKRGLMQQLLTGKARVKI